MMNGRDDLPSFPMARRCPYDPPPGYTEARNQDGLARVRMWDGTIAWLATRFEDVQEVLANPAFSAEPHRPGYPFPSAALESLLKNERPTFVLMDGAEHARYRRMLAKSFRLSHINAMEPYLQSVVDQTLEDMVGKGQPADFFEDFALVIPSLAISELLGVPYEDHQFFQECARDRMNLSAGPEVPIRAGERMGEYIGNLLARKDAMDEPPDDLLGRLLVEQIRPGHLSREDAIAIARLILVAGHETTANVIAMGALTLMKNPDQLEMLKQDGSLVPDAVEEMLRYLTIPHFNSIRVAKEDTMVGEQPVKVGEGVLAMINAANRDPAEFPEPDRFDITRKDIHHITFAYGVHQCLGQPLARLELQLVFSTLFKRLPNLRLAVPEEELRFKHDQRAYGVYSLPVIW
jgi:cytochrome P450